MKRGFTLIELLIAICIVMIIAAIFLPMFFGKKHHHVPDSMTIPSVDVPASAPSAP